MGAFTIDIKNLVVAQNIRHDLQRFSVPSRLLRPITKTHNTATPNAHMFVPSNISPVLKMNLEWAWGLDPQRVVISMVTISCTALNEHTFSDRSDILRKYINGDFALIPRFPTMTTLNRMFAYFLLPYDTARVYYTRTLGAEFIKHR